MVIGLLYWTWLVSLYDSNTNINNNIDKTYNLQLINKNIYIFMIFVYKIIISIFEINSLHYFWQSLQQPIHNLLTIMWCVIICLSFILLSYVLFYLLFIDCNLVIMSLVMLICLYDGINMLRFCFVSHILLYKYYNLIIAEKPINKYCINTI